MLQSGTLLFSWKTVFLDCESVVSNLRDCETDIQNGIQPPVGLIFLLGMKLVKALRHFCIIFASSK